MYLKMMLTHHTYALTLSEILTTDAFFDMFCITMCQSQTISQKIFDEN